MSAALAPGQQDGISTALGWAIFVSFLLLFFNIINLPRAPLDEREPLQLVHDSLGLVVGLLCMIRLYWFAKGPAPEPPVGMPAASFAFSRTILFVLIMTFALEFLLGIFYAWGEGREVMFFGWNPPQIIDTSETLRKSTGYPHSALAFYYLMLMSLWLALGAYQNYRYKVGWRRLFPGRPV